MNVWGIPDGLLKDKEVKYAYFSLNYILKGGKKNKTSL